jgi:hypothetical protein
VAHLTLTWRHAGVWQTRTVSRRVALDARAIMAMADEGMPVDSSTAGLVVSYLAACEVVEGVPVESATSVLGWQKSGVYQWGGSTIGGTPLRLVADGGAAQIADAMHAAGTLDDWLGVWSQAQNHPRLVIAIYASLSACLLGVVPDAPSYVVDFSGRSSTGKSTAMEVAASVWGQPSALVSPWSDTGNAIERKAAMLTHLPTMLDDTKQARTEEHVSRVLYDVCAPRGRGRATVTGLQRSVSLRTVLLSTGERPAVSHSQDAGSRARTLTIQGMTLAGGDRPENRRLAEFLHLRCAECYGHLGPVVVAWLAERRAEWPALAAEWRTIRAGYSPDTPDSGFLGRAAGYLALLELSGKIAERAAGLAYRPRAMVEACAAAEAGVLDADRAKAAMLDLLSYMAGRRVDLYRVGYNEMGTEERHTPDRAIGRWDEQPDAIGILPPVAREALTKMGHQLDDVRGTWAERGWLVKTGDEFRWSARIGGSDKARLLGITPKALAECGWHDGGGGDGCGGGDPPPEF